MEKLVKAVNKVLWDTDLIASRCTLAMAEFFWSVLLLWPGITFSRPTYSHMALIANEETWGLVLGMSAVIQLTIVLRGDYHTVGAKYFAAWNAVFWGYIVISMLMSVSPPPAAIGGEIALSVTAVWIWLRPYILAEGMRRGTAASTQIE